MPTPVLTALAAAQVRAATVATAVTREGLLVLEQRVQVAGVPVALPVVHIIPARPVRVDP